MESLCKPDRRSPLLSLAPLMVLVLLLSGCDINNIPTYDEQVTAAWSQVENQYQRRADLAHHPVQRSGATRELEGRLTDAQASALNAGDSQVQSSDELVSEV